MIYDISPRLTPRIGVWPGDTPLSREVLCDMAPPPEGSGSNITLSTIRTTVHLGAHADGPNHYGHPAPGIGERSLEPYLGACHVLAADVARGERVGTQHVRWPEMNKARITHPRVLIRTGTYPDPDQFTTDFAALEPSLIDALGDQGVFTIGIDTPSVDLFSSKDLPAHKAFLRREISILEGLLLADVPPGEYELIALPLRLMGFDASPVRAVLRDLPPRR